MMLAVVSLVCLGAMGGDKPGPASERYGVALDAAGFAQGTPQQALASVVKAIEAKRVDYLLAHLADPTFVDGRVKVTGGDFRGLLAETTDRLVNDPGALKLLRRARDEGQWSVDGAEGSVRLKDETRVVRFRKVGERWFMENSRKPRSLVPGRSGD